MNEISVGTSMSLLRTGLCPQLTSINIVTLCMKNMPASLCLAVSAIISSRLYLSRVAGNLAPAWAMPALEAFNFATR